MIYVYIGPRSSALRPNLGKRNNNGKRYTCTMGPDLQFRGPIRNIQVGATLLQKDSEREADQRHLLLKREEIGEIMDGSKSEKEAMDFESGAVNHHELDSSDEEIDYSVEPEFYDPKLDDVDEVWVNKQRKNRSSDAVLSCPACFTTLCLDCQRHEKYVTQYRAMFVRNCTVRTDQILREGKQKRRSAKRGPNSGSSEPKKDSQGLTYRPVCCSVCSTEVGVLDEEEVYHFFNVIPSNS